MLIAPQTYQVEYDVDKSYFWSLSNGDAISVVDNTIIVQWPDSAGEYTISVHTMRFGCEGDTSHYQVVITECAYPTLFFPTSFTPNGDERNEVYYIGGKSAENIEHMSIYNRWGDVVYEVDGNIPWDGSNCAIGLYVVNVFVNNNRFIRPVMLVR
jgi:hypothetical protein